MSRPQVEILESYPLPRPSPMVKAEFLNIISHELPIPLSLIIGQMTVSQRHLPKRNQVAFKVVDTEIDIAREALANLFENLGQLDSSTSRSYGSAGLGLYIAREFSELLDGSLIVAGEPAQGSTFTVALPLRA
jgi:signal transduction histidine kinase